MPTQAEAARQAQEDAMARQAMLQAAAQRQANAVRGDMQTARRGNEDAQVRAAQIQADAQLGAAQIMADRDRGVSKDVGDRQERVARIGLEASEYQKAQIAAADRAEAREGRKMDADIGFAARENAARQLRGGQDAPAKPQTVHEAVNTGKTAVAPAPARTPYDARGFNADVADYAEAAGRMRERGMTPAFTNAGSKGEFIEGPRGGLNVGSRSSTADRATMLANAKQPASASAVDHVALQKALNMRPEVTGATPAPAAPGASPAAAAPVNNGLKLSDRDLRDVNRSALGLGPSISDKASDSAIAEAQKRYSETKDPVALQFLKDNGVTVLERKLTKMDLESDPTYQANKTSLRSAADKRSSGWFPNLDSTNRKANFNADDALMQMYNAGLERGFTKDEMKKMLQAEIVRMNMAYDIQWGLPDTILGDK